MKPFTRWADQQRIADSGQLAQSPEQGQALRRVLAEANAGIGDQMPPRYASRLGLRQAPAKLIDDICHHICILIGITCRCDRKLVRVVDCQPAVHEQQRHAESRLRRRWPDRNAGPTIVDGVGAGIQGGAGNLRAKGVDRNRQIDCLGECLDDGNDACFLQ